jgi:hydrogenase nickel incorporation protein HypB
VHSDFPHHDSHVHVHPDFAHRRPNHVDWGYHDMSSHLHSHHPHGAGNHHLTHHHRDHPHHVDSSNARVVCAEHEIIPNYDNLISIGDSYHQPAFLKYIPLRTA